MDTSKHYRSLKQALENPLEVERLDLIITDIEYDLSEDLILLKNLKHLLISSHNTTKLTNTKILLKLENLEDLSLYLYSLETIPEEIWQLTNLKRLELYNWKIEYLPKEIGQLKRLERLSIAQGFLATELPKEIGQLRKLRGLFLGGCKFEKLPEEIGSLINLTDINLRGNNISELPNTMSNLLKLERLWLSDNNLSVISESIAKLPKLEALDLERNPNLKEIPIIFTKIKRLMIEDEKYPASYLDAKIQKSNEISNYLKEELKKYKRIAYKPILKDGDSSPIASKFGGIPYIPKDEKYPICQICGKPLQFFFQVNLNKMDKEIKEKFGEGLLQFFHCTNQPTIERLLEVYEKESELISSQQKETLKTFKDANQIEFLIQLSKELEDNSYIKEESKNKLQELDLYHTSWFFLLTSPCLYLADDTTYFAPFKLARIIQTDKPARKTIQEKSFPPQTIIAWEKIEDYPISEFRWDYRKDYAQLTEADKEFFYKTHNIIDKLGGWATWIQDNYYPECKICGEEMNNIIFQLTTGGILPHQWGDSGACYIFQCPKHKHILTSFEQGC